VSQDGPECLGVEIGHGASLGRERADRIGGGASRRPSGRSPTAALQNPASGRRSATLAAGYRPRLAQPFGPNPASLWFLSDSHVMTSVKRRRIRRARIAGPSGGPKREVSVKSSVSKRFSEASDPQVDPEVG
jgi:hypothetical protein